LKKNLLHPKRNAKATTKNPLIPEPLPLSTALVDARHLMTSPWVRMFQRMLVSITDGSIGGGGSGGAGGEGPPGSEYAGVVSTFTLDTPYYKEDGTGQMTLYLPFHWIRPSDPDSGYIGSEVWWINKDGVHRKLSDLTTGNGTVVELHEFPVDDDEYWDVEFYLLSSSTSGQNTYHPGPNPEDTPRILTRIYGPALTVINVPLFKAFIRYSKDEFGNNIYYFDGSWGVVNKALNPRWQGVKVAMKTSDLAAPLKYVTGIVTDNPGTFKSETYPLQMHEVPDFDYFYMYAISVDVNGRENSYLASPRAGPLILSEQGGTIKNENLPLMDTANFAAGTEPVTFVAGVVDGNGYLPTSVALKTTVVFNNTDRRLYRWDASVLKYKVVGTATDIDASTITAGMIKAGAVTSYQMAAQEILVGPLPFGGVDSDRRPILLQVQNAQRIMMGFFGEYAGYQGIYALNARFGPSFVSPTIECTALGIFIHGSKDYPVEFQIDSATEDYVRMSKTTFDPTYQTLAVQVSDSGKGPNGIKSNQCFHASRGVVLYEGTKVSGVINHLQIGALARNPNYGVGEVVLYDDNHIQRVYLSCVDVNMAGPPRIGFVRAERFDCGGAPGVMNQNYDVLLAGGGQVQLRIRGGLIVQ